MTCPTTALARPECSCPPCTTALIRTHAPHLLAHSPQPAASTPPPSDLSGAGIESGSGLCATFPLTDQAGPGSRSDSAAPGPPTYGVGWSE